MPVEFRIATPRVAAGVLFRDTEGQVLLVKPTYKSGWDIPGGYAEPGESPKAAATREVREELGLDVTVGKLLLVDWAPHPDEGDKLLFVFEGGVLDAAKLACVVLQQNELEQVQFVAIESLNSYLNTRLQTRLASAALRPEDPYAERGSASR